MGGNPGLDNGNHFLRAHRQAPPTPYMSALWQAAGPQYDAQRAALWQAGGCNSQQNAPPACAGASSGERPEPEDTTGLKLLDEFLAKRRRERDGNRRPEARHKRK